MLIEQNTLSQEDLMMSNLEKALNSEFIIQMLRKTGKNTITFIF